MAPPLPNSAHDRRDGADPRDPIPYALETDWLAEDPVKIGPVSPGKIPVEVQKPGNRLILSRISPS